MTEATGSVILTADEFDFHVSYFQGPRYSIALELLWKGPNATKFTYMPSATLLRPWQ